MGLHRLGQVDAAVDILSVKTTLTTNPRTRQLEDVVASIFKNQAKDLKQSSQII
jgi:hypothetical protein